MQVHRNNRLLAFSVFAGFFTLATLPAAADEDAPAAGVSREDAVRRACEIIVSADMAAEPTDLEQAKSILEATTAFFTEASTGCQDALFNLAACLEDNPFISQLGACTASFQRKNLACAEDFARAKQAEQAQG